MCLPSPGPTPNLVSGGNRRASILSVLHVLCKNHPLVPSQLGAGRLYWSSISSTSHALVPPCSELPAVGAHEQRKELWKSCMVSQAAPRAASAGSGHLQPRAGCWCWGRCMQGTCRVTQAMGPHSCMKEQSGIVAKLSVLAVAPGSLRKH